MKGPLTIVFISLCVFSYSQNLDSLESALDDSKGTERVKIYNELFKALLNSEPQRAIYYSRNGLEYATEINDYPGISQSLNNLGVAFKNLGVYDVALDYYTKAYSLNDSIGNNEGLALNLNNIANVYVIKNDTEKALEYFLDTYEIVRFLGDEKRTIQVLNNIGNIYSDRTFHDKAEEYHRKAIKKAQESGNEDLTIEPLYNLGNINFLRLNYDSAVYYYNEALSVAKLSQNKEAEVYISINIAKSYGAMNKYNMAFNYLGSAEALANEFSGNKYLAEILKTKSEVFKERGMLNEAYNLLLSYNNLVKDIHAQELKTRIEEAARVTEFRMKDRVSISERLLAEQKKEITNLELEKSRMVVILGLMLMLLLVAAGFTVYILRKGKKSGLMSNR